VVGSASVELDVRRWALQAWDPAMTVQDWWSVLAASGYAAPSLPQAAGGRGYDHEQVMAVRRALADVGVMGPPPGVGMMLAAPTIASCGTAEQVARLIPPILDGRHAWCQLFSEPNAGSDLAGLQCRAELDGDEWVITGQKVWTSNASFANMGMLLARTDPTQPKHAGISYFAFRMDQPGVEVRPLREMSGRALFNEVFIDEARVAQADVIGAPGDGWRVGNATLSFEREHLGSASVLLPSVHPGRMAGNLTRSVGEAIVTAEVGEEGVPDVGPQVLRGYLERAAELGRLDDAVLRDGLMNLYILVEVNRLSSMRASVGHGIPGHANLAKLVLSETYRRFREVGCQLLGAEAMLAAGAAEAGSIHELIVYSPGPAIYGGSDQIQRNVVGERVLGLPKEPGSGSKRPFNEILKN
jgi:alkylation response protein AidB-like acyl-CoA dehydrogenase